MNSPDAQFIGLDIGRSAVKAIARHNSRSYTVNFPSCVTPAERIVFGELKESAPPDTVTLRDQSYWVGKTARIQDWGAPGIGRYDDWVLSDQHDILVLAAMKKLQREGLNYDGNAVITLGLPSRVFRYRGDLAQALHTRISALLSIGSSKPDVHVHAQSMAVVARHTIDVDGSDLEGGASFEQGRFAVIEVGQFTTNFLLLERSVPIRMAMTSCDGVEAVIHQLRAKLRDQNMDVTNADLEDLAVKRKMSVRGACVDMGPLLDQAVDRVFVPYVIENAMDSFGSHIENVDQVLVAGGGAPLLLNGLKSTGRFDHAVLVDEPRFAVANGLAKISAVVHSLESNPQVA